MADSTASPASPTEMRDCPFCGQGIRAKALKCPECGKWMHSASPPEPVPAAAGGGSRGGGRDGYRYRAAADTEAAGIEVQEYSSGQLPKHLVLLTVVSLGLYELYWFYRNWCDLRDHAGKELSPGLRTLGLMIPFVNIVMVYQQLAMIRDVATEAGETEAYTPATLTMVIVVLTVIANLTATWAISLLTVVALIPVQETLNRFWARKQPGMPIRTEFDPREVAILFVGGLITMMALAQSLAG